MKNSTPELEAERLAAAIHEFEVADSCLQTCALVYGAAYPQLYRELRWRFGLETVSYRLSLIFDAHSQESGDQYGPFLVRIAPGAPKPSDLLKRLTRYCIDDFRSVSFLISSLSFSDLAAGLRERLAVKREDRSEWQMKFFDTRSLSVLDRTLSAEQRRTYFCVVKEWWYLDRYGEQQKIAGEDAAIDLYRGPLQLDERQATSFDDAGLPDFMLHSLQLSDGDLLANFDARTRYRICEGAVAAASESERNNFLLLEDCVREAFLIGQEKT